MFAFCQDGGDYLEEPLLTACLETIFQIEELHKGKGAGTKNTTIYKGPNYKGHLGTKCNFLWAICE